MSIGIADWRMRIGCFLPSSKDSHSLSCFKSNAFLTFNVKRYLLLCSILLLLSGDVELNQGPALCNIVFPLQGNIHQGSSLFYGSDSVGRQCVPCCIIFFAVTFMKPFNDVQWKSNDLDGIIHAGNILYKFSKEAFRWNDAYLMPTDVAAYISMNGTNISWRVVKTYYGTIDPNFIGEYPLVKLEIALGMALSFNKYALLICKGNAIGILRHTSTDIVIFDSHARNKDGLCCENGKCVLLKMESVAEVCKHIRSLMNSLSGGQLNFQEQFDLHSMSFSEISYKTIQRVQRSGVRVCKIETNSYKGRENYTVSSVVTAPETNIENSEHISPRLELIDLPFLNENNCNRHKRKHASDKTNKDVTKKRKTFSDVNASIVNKFHADFSKGPDYICTSCSQVFFKHSVVKISRSNFSERLLNTCTSGAVSVEGNEYICNQCNDYLKKGNIPPLSRGNGLSFPAIPPELDGLTQLEERLISPRIPFMQIRELPRGGQLRLKGNVINVPSDVNLTVKALPRNMNDSETIPVKFKRRLSYKSHIVYEQIRPERVIKAAKWLVENSSLFQSEGIYVKENWTDHSSRNVETHDPAGVDDIIQGVSEDTMS